MTTATRGESTLELHASGERAQESTPGALVCVECGYAISLHRRDTLPRCPACAGKSFRRGSMFDQPTGGVETVAIARAESAALSDARERLAGVGAHLIWEDDGEVREVTLTEGWARIGRSGHADILLDDPTVSRRHALVVRTEQDELKALDDRSLNGLFVNGKRVEWTPLADGDELEIGRFRIYVVV